jgi:hypothetical protein
MVRPPIAKNCELANMHKGKESMDNGEYEFGMVEDGTIVAGEGGSEKKKRPASGGGMTPRKSNDNGKAVDRPAKKQRVGHRPSSRQSRQQGRH